MKKTISLLAIILLAFNVSKAQYREIFNVNGNVGIGNPNPSSLLEVGNGQDGKLSVFSQHGGDWGQIQIANPGDGEATLGFCSNCASVGNNVSSQAGSSHVWAVGLNVWNIGGSNFGIGAASYGGPSFVLTADGNAGIGTTAPSARLSVNGNANNATGVWNMFSDARIKTVTGDFKEGLDVIEKIHPVTFLYNEKAPFCTDEPQVGIIAQELEKIAPYMVSQIDNGTFKDLREVNPQAYIFLLINAIKEQQAQIEAQKASINTLQSQVQTLNAKVDASLSSSAVGQLEVK